MIEIEDGDIGFWIRDIKENPAFMYYSSDVDKLIGFIKKLQEELKVRSKQIGVACEKHDLTHSLKCGVCYRQVYEENTQLLNEMRLLKAECHDRGLAIKELMNMVNTFRDDVETNYIVGTEWVDEPDTLIIANYDSMTAGLAYLAKNGILKYIEMLGK